MAAPAFIKTTEDEKTLARLGTLVGEAWDDAFGDDAEAAVDEMVEGVTTLSLFQFLDGLSRLGTTVNRALPRLLIVLPGAAFTSVLPRSLGSRVITMREAAEAHIDFYSQVAQWITGTDSDGLLELVGTRLALTIKRLWKKSKLLRALLGVTTEEQLFIAVSAILKSKIVKAALFGILIFLFTGFLFVLMPLTVLYWKNVVKGLPQDSKRRYGPRKGQKQHRENAGPGPDRK